MADFLVAGDTYTRLALEVRLRQILRNSSIGIELGEEETEFLKGVLALHAEAERKIGAGVRAFRVTASKYGSRCFEVLRVDGTSAEFSYIKCLRKKKGEAHA